MRDLWRSIGLTSGARIYSVLAGALSLVLTARTLGPDGRGAVAAAITWALLFASCGHLSLGQVANHRATGKPVDEWLRPVLTALIVMTALVTLTGWTIAGALYAFSGGRVFGGLSGYAFVL